MKVLKRLFVAYTVMEFAAIATMAALAVAGVSLSVAGALTACVALMTFAHMLLR